MNRRDRRRERRKKMIGAIYSATAGRVYDTVVVKGAFRVFGGGLHAIVAEQGRAAIEVSDEGPILDMPVGTAYFTLEMARAHGGLVVGVDIAEGMVQEAQRAARAMGVTNLCVVQADAHHLPFKDGAFPAIMCTNGIQVMPGLEPTLAELNRVLQRGGSLFLSTITLPIGAALTERSAAQLPTVLMSDRELTGALGRAGLRAGSATRSRLGLTYTAVKSGTTTASGP